MNSVFHTLTPDMAINLVEKSLGEPLLNLCRPMTSYINRVFEMQLKSGEFIIAKFYRPGRWSRAALQDEHDFLKELSDREIPAIPPLSFADGATIHEHDGTYYTIFKKKGGRALDEPNDDEWEQLGRLLARVHSVGELHLPKDRLVLKPDESTNEHLEYLLKTNLFSAELRQQYEAAAREIIALVTPLFKEVKLHRIHGDCHRANILKRPDEGLFLIDFDDMAVGPAVQDFWMILPGVARESALEIDLFMEGYETFKSFDRRTLKLIEPLRAMRYIYFTAWCAMQAADGGFAKLVPDWGSNAFWQREIKELQMQRDEIRSVLEKDF
ncbi:MAG: serine/threonine protein kinase [Bacteroidota bacterium]